MNPQPPVTSNRFMDQVPPAATLTAGRVLDKARLRGAMPGVTRPDGPRSEEWTRTSTGRHRGKRSRQEVLHDLLEPRSIERGRPGMLINCVPLLLAIRDGPVKDILPQT